MKLTIYQIDAFANKAFEGNPAAICPLQEWLDDEALLSIAEENNLSETAYFIKINFTQNKLLKEVVNYFVSYSATKSVLQAMPLNTYKVKLKYNYNEIN